MDQTHFVCSGSAGRRNSGMLWHPCIIHCIVLAWKRKLVPGRKRDVFDGTRHCVGKADTGALEISQKIFEH